MIDVKLGRDRRVQLPDRQWVPKEGMKVERSTFIERRLIDGDLVDVTPEKAKDAADAPAPGKTVSAIAAPAKES